MWYVYIIKCRNKALYTGITDDIKRRLREHNSGKGGNTLQYGGRLCFYIMKRIGINLML
jgi:putative endonuclease